MAKSSCNPRRICAVIRFILFPPSFHMAPVAARRLYCSKVQVVRFISIELRQREDDAEEMKR